MVWYGNGYGYGYGDGSDHVSGWKSLIERHKRVLVLKRPLGVIIIIDGGLYG
jgi:hypothetical protein